MSLIKKVAKKTFKKVIKPAIKKTGVAPYARGFGRVVGGPVRGIRGVTRALQGSQKRQRRTTRRR